MAMGARQIPGSGPTDADFIPAASRGMYIATTDVQRRRDVVHRASGCEEFHGLMSLSRADGLRPSQVPPEDTGEQP